MKVKDLDLLSKLQDKVRKCNNCFLGDRCLQHVPGDGNPLSKIVLVGEAPGTNEDIYGKPFVGIAGKLLNEMLEQAGLNRQDLYVTNVVKCRPSYTKDGKTATPRQAQIDVCGYINLKPELRLIDPEVIVPMGNVALKGLGMGRVWQSTHIAGSISDARRFIYKIEPHSSRSRGALKWIAPTFHPSYCSRNRNMIDIAVQDFKIAKTLAESSAPLLNNVGKRTIMVKGLFRY